jgi:hypothetical protein
MGMLLKRSEYFVNVRIILIFADVLICANN